jgi:hypothetical protein
MEMHYWFKDPHGSIIIVSPYYEGQSLKNFVKNHERIHPWVVIANNRKVYKKVSNDINRNAIKGLYFYSNTIGEREF